MRSLLAAFVLVSASLASAATEASVVEELHPNSNLFLESMLVGTYQRTGAFVDLRMRYRKELYESENEAFSGNFWGVGLIEQATPIFSQSGAYVELQPASFIRLTGAYELIGYFGTFNTMRTVRDCEGVQGFSASDSRCAFPLSNPSAPPGKADYGHRVWAEALSQATYGRVSLSDNFTAERWFFRDDWAAGAGATHWVNELFALPQRKQDTVLTNTAMATVEVLPDLSELAPHLSFGVMSSFNWAAGTNYFNHRVGPVGILHIPEWRGMRDIAAVLMVQFYTHDRYARGPVPFVGLAVTVSTPNFVPKELR